MFVKKLFRLRIWSPRHKYENKIKTENSKSNIPENVKVKTVNTTSVSDGRLGVMNVSSLGNKMDCVIDHIITDNRLDIVNLCFSSGVFPTPCKSSIIFHLIKKPCLDPEILKNYRPVANLSFISKIIEKAIATQIHDHLINNDIVDNFQSAYKAGHSCETALLRVYYW